MRLAPLYTRANVYYSENAYYLLLSDAEVVERTLLAHFFDIDKFQANDFGLGESPRILWTQPAMIERNVHWLHDRLGIVYERQYAMRRELLKVRAVLASLEQEGWDINLLRRYRLDYFVWDSDVSPDWNLNSYSELEEVYRNNHIAIYKFKDT